MGDLGISVDELCTLAVKDQLAAEPVIRRIESLHIDPDRFDPSAMRDLQHRCSNCADKKLCTHGLKDKPVTAIWPKYCPNEYTINALTARSKSTE